MSLADSLTFNCSFIAAELATTNVSIDSIPVTLRITDVSFFDGWFINGAAELVPIELDGWLVNYTGELMLIELDGWLINCTGEWC